jgi:hypothetical protein
MSAGAEMWIPAPYLISAEMHSTLGNSPSWIDAKFAITSPTPFPWIRMRAIDKIDGVVIAIWRFDAVKKSFDGNVLVWEAIGRDALYGIQDNSLRPPTRYMQPGGVNPDPAYTEWPTTATTANAADFEEATFPTVTEKVGPNYMNKAAKRGWIVKDMTRFSAGYASSPSRPIIAVYNRGKDIIPQGQTTPLGEVAEGEILRSNFSQAQGDSANQLVRDVTKSWPWTSQEGVGIGYDYRAVWPGKTDPFAVSGQAMELFPRGSQVGGIPCIDFPVPCPPCPHPPIDGCDDCLPPPTSTCVSRVDVTTHWTRPTPVRDIVVGGIVSTLLNFERSVDRCVNAAFGGDDCPTQDVLDANGSGGSNPIACGVYLIQRATSPHNGYMSQTYSLAAIPTPAELCDAPRIDPFTDYVISADLSRNSFWSVGAEPWTCPDDAALRPHMASIDVNLYVGELQALDCTGTQDDYWVTIGSGSTTCAGSPSLSYSINVPSSLCYFENGGASLDSEVQAFLDG